MVVPVLARTFAYVLCGYLVRAAESVPLTRCSVLVLESCRAEWWNVGMLEYSAESELHPCSGLGLLVALRLGQ